LPKKTFFRCLTEFWVSPVARATTSFSRRAWERGLELCRRCGERLPKNLFLVGALPVVVWLALRRLDHEDNLFGLGLKLLAEQDRYFLDAEVERDLEPEVAVDHAERVLPGAGRDHIKRLEHAVLANALADAGVGGLGRPAEDALVVGMRPQLARRDENDAAGAFRKPVREKRLDR